MNLRRIEAFLAVVEARSISRAATQLEAAQSVVSRHIAAREMLRASTTARKASMRRRFTGISLGLLASAA